MRNISSRIGLIALGALAAGACSKKEEQPPVDSTTAPAAAPAPAPQTLSVIAVDLGRSIGPDKRVTTPETSFSRKDTVYASVSTEGAPPSATLIAKWTSANGQVVDSTAQTIMPTGPSVTEFHVSKPGGLPVGKYTVTIFADGVQAKSVEFEVKK